MGEYSRNNMIEKMLLNLESHAYELMEEMDKGYQVKEVQEMKEFKLSCIFKSIEKAKEMMKG